MDPAPRTPRTGLAPLPYHRAVVAYLKANEPEVWAWGSSTEAEQESIEQMRTLLLRNCYRLEADSHPELVAACARVAQRLDVHVPITLYQANGDSGMNAALHCTPGEAHIVFSGAVLSKLHGAELEAVLGHELAHFRLWDVERQAYLVADRILTTAANDGRGSTSHAHTAHRLRLYTEVFADRGGYIGCENFEATISALVKMATGLEKISVAAYLKQADEIFERVERGQQVSEHPELFIRARALRLWSEGDEALDTWLAAEIEGDATFDTLCLIGQQRVSALTRRVLGELLQLKSLQTPILLAHAKAFFVDFTPAPVAEPLAASELGAKDAAARDYWCYVLMDFARADAELEELPLSQALVLSQRLGLHERFRALASKELGLTERQLNRILKEAPDLLRGADAS